MKVTFFIHVRRSSIGTIDSRTCGILRLLLLAAINTFLVDDGVLKKSPEAVWGGDTKNSRLPHNTYNATAQQSQQHLVVVVVVDGVCGVMVVYVASRAHV